MNQLEKRLFQINNSLYISFEKTKAQVSLLLQQYIRNFPSYTDHSMDHTMKVLEIASELLTQKELECLNSDELYILMMACILHDVGMCIPEKKIEDLCSHEEYKFYQNNYKEKSLEIFLRDQHHILSKNFIIEEWKMLEIPTEKYAYAIALVAQGHRKVDLSDFEIYEPKHFVKSGRESVCLPYLSCILRISDELDISNIRTPEILCKYYIPDNEISRREFRKHQSTIQVNFLNDTVLIESKCTDHNILAALEEQFEKIQNVISSCQKTIRSISRIDGKDYSLEISKLEPKFVYENFDPKGIKYSFDVKNVINAFVGKDLYSNNDAALREAIQNAIDSCNYKKTLLKNHNQEIEIIISENELKICDNGLGMDEFIIENYFGKLASSYYSQESIKSDFQAIGQFGIGVFSYFLIADYIEIETKNKTSLKFRTDQDPNGYFHFFDNFNKESEGTNLILHLKTEFIGKFNFDYLEKFIRKNFPFIDFNIVLKDNVREIIIEPCKFQIDINGDVADKLYYLAQENLSKIKLLNYSLSNDRFEGIVSLIVPNQHEKVLFSPNELFIRGAFYSKNHKSFSEIKTSQKGVFINNYGSNYTFTLGLINIKDKLNINLDRTAFRDPSDVTNIINEFEYGLTKLYFTDYLASLKITKKIDIAKYSQYFLENILEDSSLNNETKELLKNSLVFKFQIDSKLKYLTLGEVEENYSEINIKDKNETTTNNPEIPSLKIELKDNYLFTVFYDVFNYAQIVYFNDENLTISLSKSAFNKISKFKFMLNYILHTYHTLCYSTSRKLAFHLYDNENLNDETLLRYSYLSVRINVNNAFIKKIDENISIIKSNSLIIKLIDEILSIITDNLMELKTQRLKNEEILNKINPIIKEINLIQHLNFEEFQADDL